MSFFQLKFNYICNGRWNNVFNAKTGRNLKNRHKDGGSPDARLRLALLRSARLRLNDGAKLWVSFKLCFKTNDITLQNSKKIQILRLTQ